MRDFDRRKICDICGKRVSIFKCRRCGKSICAKCHYGHGLCLNCAEKLVRKNFYNY